MTEPTHWEVYVVAFRRKKGELSEYGVMAKIWKHGIEMDAIIDSNGEKVQSVVEFKEVYHKGAFNFDNAPVKHK